MDCVKWVFDCVSGCLKGFFDCPTPAAIFLLFGAVFGVKMGGFWGRFLMGIFCYSYSHAKNSGYLVIF